MALLGSLFGAGQLVCEDELLWKKVTLLIVHTHRKCNNRNDDAVGVEPEDTEVCSTTGLTFVVCDESGRRIFQLKSIPQLDLQTRQESRHNICMDINMCVC
ncbi:uncharacterized protein V6R79_016127 [Siganus canaliculatus]